MKTSTHARARAHTHTNTHTHTHTSRNSTMLTGVAQLTNDSPRAVQLARNPPPRDMNSACVQRSQGKRSRPETGAPRGAKHHRLLGQIWWLRGRRSLREEERSEPGKIIGVVQQLDQGDPNFTTHCCAMHVEQHNFQVPEKTQGKCSLQTDTQGNVLVLSVEAV